MATQKKMFLQIVRQIRAIIEVDGLKPGDKIPSERELAERLLVGRSSVREGLRALELLGIIETRRGEGTFLRDIAHHKLIDVLGMFLLSNQTSKQDLIQTKEALEKEALLQCMKLTEWNEERAISYKLNIVAASREDECVFEALKLILVQSGNFLSYRIWKVLHEYFAVMKDENREWHYDRSVYLQWLEILQSKDYAQSSKFYEQYLQVREYKLCGEE